jgi:hypothetical protein
MAKAFETGLNKITAKKFMADLSPAHIQARTHESAGFKKAMVLLDKDHCWR